MPYNPTIASLISKADVDWGNPEENAKKVISYGIRYIDSALRGIDFRNGELIGIQSEPKNRKSTMLANVALNVAAHKEFWVCIDTLESGMQPEAYRDILVAITTTRIIIAEKYTYDRTTWPSYRNIVSTCGHELGISKEFLWYNKRTPTQHFAIEKAKSYLSSLPILIFGSSYEQGDARRLESSIARWDSLYHGRCPGLEGISCRLFVCDHIQQLDTFLQNGDYAGMERTIGEYGKFVSAHKGSVIIAISQLGLGSVRLEQQGMGRGMAKGGAKLEAEANVLFRTRYKTSMPHVIEIETSATRRQPPPKVYQEIDPDSGAFLAPASIQEESYE